LRGLGRLVVVTLVQFLIIYVVVAVIISVVFSVFAYNQLKQMITDMVREYRRQVAEQCKGCSPEQIKQQVELYNQSLYEQYGLTQPVEQRILLYTFRLMIFNLSGFQPYTNYPVPGKNALEITINGMIRSAILFTTAALIELAISLPVGLSLSRKIGSRIDRLIGLIAVIMNSFPLWWTGLIFLYIFAYQLRLFPLSCLDVEKEIAMLNSMNLSAFEYFTRYIATWLKYTALPIITIVTLGLAGSIYWIRTYVLIVSQEDFVMVARAKGLPERVVLHKHVLRAASPPITINIVLGLIGSLGGAIISERVFNWPGMGFVYITAINYSDAPVLLVSTWVDVILYLAAYFILDFVVMLLDPRIRIGKGVEQ